MEKIISKLKDKNFLGKLQHLYDEVGEFYKQEHIREHNARIKKQQSEEEKLLQQEHEDRETEEILFR